MKFSLSWLKEHIDLKSDLEINTIVDSLTSLGLEVESFNNHAEKLTDFIVAEVLEVKQHPNADRLNICKVNNGKNILEVVCGAKNVKKNLRVVLAPIGSTIPANGLVLKKKEIRGFIGEGMICSAEELGLEEKSEGILELPAKTEIGKSVADLKQYSDVIFEIGLTPNRGDCASLIGIARELAALGLGVMKERKKKVIKSSFKSPVKWNIDLEEKNHKACSFVVGRYFKGIKNGESPEWLKRRLVSIGLRPISCLVDLTNYITFDLGRPLHVFDAKKINGDLTIRMAKEEEKIKALDGKDYTLNSSILAIADEKTIVSLAGVMGGESSSCDFDTSEMFLESALFDPTYISNTGRKLNILSDARYRFERGVDASYVEEGLNIMTELVLDLCGGEVSDIVKSGVIETKSDFIDYDPDSANRLSGLNISSKRQQDILLNLGFEVKVNQKYFKIKPPSWRHDIKNDIDIVEEIIRINGYDNLQEFQLPYYYSDKPVLNISEVRNRLIRNSLIKQGLFESVTFSFLSREDNKNYSDKNIFVELDNPISEELSVMRTSLIPNLVNNFLSNINKGLKNIGLFEVGAIYLGDKIEDQFNSAAGIRAGLAGKRHWSDNPRNIDLYDAKKDIYSSLSVLGVNLNNINITKVTPSWYHPGRSGSINLGKTVLGYFGELHPSLNKKYGIRMVAFEIFPDNLPKTFNTRKNKEYKHYNLMPIKRDFSFYLNSEKSSFEIQNTIKTTLHNNSLVKLVEINIFDLYEDKTSEKTRRSIALEVILQPIENTLNDNQIKVISDLIIEKVQEKNDALLKD